MEMVYGCMNLPFAFCLIATKPLQGYDSDEGHIFQWWRNGVTTDLQRTYNGGAVSTDLHRDLFNLD